MGAGYAPAIAQALSVDCTALDYDAERRQLFIGLENGKLEIVALSEDFCAFEVEASLQMHTKRVTAIVYDSGRDWILSVGRDKKIRVYNLRANNMFGTRTGGAWISSMAFDAVHGRAFLGAYSGVVLMFGISGTTVTPIGTLEGHTGSVRSLALDSTGGRLYSGSFDCTICCWDLGAPGREFLTKLTRRLEGSRDEVDALVLSPDCRMLFSAGADHRIRAWDLASGAEIHSWRAATSDIMCLELVADRAGGLILASAGKDKAARVWFARPPEGRSLLADV